MIVVGQIGAPHGVKGWVHVRSFTVPPESLLNYRFWHLKMREQWMPQMIEVLEIRPQGGHFAALLKGYEDRDQAGTLTNVEIGVPREELPELEDDRYYWNDLIGMQVITETGEALGVVSSLFETGSNDVLVVQGETREHLVPFILEDYVLEVNVESRIIRVAWDPEF